MKTAPVFWKVFRIGIVLLALALCVSASPVSADGPGPQGTSSAYQKWVDDGQHSQIGHGVLTRPPNPVFPGYSSLPQMINQVCEEASSQFNDFFGPSMVKVKPFSVLDEFTPRRPTVLGVTLADQMAARINSDGHEQASAKGNQEQLLEGVIHELNGYLRVHMSAVNTRGERRSYVVNVEMSEPVYRSLHTFIAAAE